MTRPIAFAVLALLASAPAACQGSSGTIELGLTTAPGSTLLDGVHTLRITLTNPLAIRETTRGASGFDLELEVEATGGSGRIIVDGFDATGSLVATGMSPPFVIASIDAAVVVYMAFPMSIERAPEALAAPLELVSATRLPYGAILAGGRDPGTQAPTDAVWAYNAYDHTLVPGRPMPAPRAGVALGVGANNSVYMFGGRDAAAQPTGTLWRFDTTAAPSGSYAEIGEEAGYARSDDAMVPLGVERFLITGAPVLELSRGNLSTRPDRPLLGHAGAGVVGTDGVPAAVFADGTGIVMFREETFTVLDPTPRQDVRVGTLPRGAVLVLDWDRREVIRVDVATGTLTHPPVVLDGVATAPVATSRHLLIGGEVYDVESFAWVTRFPNPGTPLVALPNDQVLLLEGAELRLFTPPPPLLE